MDVIKKHYEKNNIHIAFLLSKILRAKIQFKDKNEFNDIFHKLVIKLDNNVFKNKYTRVLLTCNWCSNKELCDLWNKFSRGNYCWNDIQVVWEEPCDYYCVINYPSVEIIPEKTILFFMEPNVTLDYNQYWVNIPKNNFKFYGEHKNHYNNNEWHLSKNYLSLKNEPIIKDKKLDNVISAILSDKYVDLGHKKRINFAKFLEARDVKLHIFGNSAKFNWDNYMGTLPYHTKDDGLFPYKYTFNVENHSIENYYTEKIIDAILSECLIFYHGCPNIKDLIDERAFVWLELKDFKSDFEIVRKALEEDLWSQRIEFIRKEKFRILEELQFFPRLEKIIYSENIQI